VYPNLGGAAPVERHPELVEGSPKAYRTPWVEPVETKRAPLRRTRLASIRRFAPTLRQAQGDARPALDLALSQQSPNFYMRPSVSLRLSQAGRASSCLNESRLVSATLHQSKTLGTEAVLEYLSQACVGKIMPGIVLGAGVEYPPQFQWAAKTVSGTER